MLDFDVKIKDSFMMKSWVLLFLLRKEGKNIQQKREKMKNCLAMTPLETCQVAFFQFSPKRLNLYFLFRDRDVSVKELEKWVKTKIYLLDFYALIKLKGQFQKKID